MKGIQLKLKGEWVALPEDFSLKLEQTNPLFNEQGTFSFPFEVPLEPNRSLFKNIADPFGDIRLKDIDGMEAELWFNGVMLYKGLVETDEEVEFEDGIPMTFISGNADFMSKIEGMNAQDIPLDREIKLGYVITTAKAKKSTGKYKVVYLPSHVMMNYTEYNVSDPYPINPYCNVRVCTSNEQGKYRELGAKRPFSGVCFYLMYFLNCLFKHLSISISENDLTEVEDMNRLAFFTTKCQHTLSEKEFEVGLSEIMDKDFCGESFYLDYYFKWVSKYKLSKNDFDYVAKNVFATKGNFPDVAVKDIISDLYNAFGAKIVYNQFTNSVQLLFLKNIMKAQETESLDLDMISYSISKRKENTFKLTYGNDKDISFDYNEYSNVKLYKDYSEIIKNGVSPYDTTCYVDTHIGNTYRIKVNKETGKEPALFEAGTFNSYLRGSGETEDMEVSSINFQPVIVNDVAGSKSSSQDSEAANDQRFAIFVDVELKSAEYESSMIEIDKFPTGGIIEETWFGSNIPENYDTTNSEEAPLRTYDAGYTLGIMRGPGNKSKVEYVENYDGEGNSSWVQVVATYAFTSDSCDNYGRFFDYNGTEAGGADQTGRFSLKLVAGKEGFPIDSQYANRGLVSKFLSEYLYFLENRKTVMLEVEMSITQLINIDFLKRYKIGDFVGFINKVSYNMTVNGMEDVVIEMYTL